MIQGQLDNKKIPYRQREGLNYSSLKTFEDEGVGVFYREFVLEEKKEKISNSLVIGQLVDDIVLNYKGDLQTFYQDFHNKYVKFEGTKSTAQAFVLADVLFDVIVPSIKDGVVTADFEASFKSAFDTVQAMDKYKGKTWEKGLEDFNKTAKEYFDTKIAGIGKIVVDLSTLQIAENVANQLMTDEFTAPLLKNERGYILPKVELEFKYLDVLCKGEVDFIEIDHDKKEIYPFDMKCLYDNENFDYAYIKYRYFLQQAFYSEGLVSWAEENGFGDYTIYPFTFLVGDTSVNKRRPLLYHLTGEDMAKGVTGFFLNGKEYRGIHDIVQDIKWHMDNDVWNCSKEAIVNNGSLTLKINYDK